MDIRAEARPPTGVKVNIAVNHDQREIGAPRDYRPQRRQLTQVELARLITVRPACRRFTIAVRVRVTREKLRSPATTAAARAALSCR